MTGITWLHLSDWHQEGSDFNRTNVRDALLRDIRERENQISPDLKQIDFIVFSGDVAFHGKQEEYEAAWKELFKPLLDELKVPPERLFIVPGNHDLDRSVVQNSDYSSVLKKPFGDDDNFKTNDDVNTALTTKTDRLKTDRFNKLLEPFSDFNIFLNSYLEENKNENELKELRYAYFRKLENKNELKELRYAYFRKLEVNSQQVSLLGINSALMAGRESSPNKIDDYGKLIVGEPQVQELITKAQNSDIKIAVLHHPFEWLTEFDRNTSGVRLRNNCHFILCGHQHSPDFVRTNGIKGNYVMIPAGASYERGDYRNGYNFVHLDFLKDLGTVYLRRWSRERGGGTWIRDEDSCDGGKYNFYLSDLFENFQELKSRVASTLPPPDEKKVPEALNRRLQLALEGEKIPKKILEDNIVLFLGADINLCGRTVQNPWEWNPKGNHPPINLELAAYLDNKLKNECNSLNYLEKVGCPLCDQKPTYQNCPINNTREITHLALQHVSQYFWLLDSDSLNLAIVDDIYKNENYEPNKLHLFLAKLPRLVKEYYKVEGSQVKYPLIVTTCFDQTLESAFKKEKQQFDLVSYCGNDKFSYQRFENENKENHSAIASPNEHCWFNDCPVILRLYGPGKSTDKENPEFAITENDFLNYLSSQSYQTELPPNLITKLTNNSILFLGYSLSYWNFRGIVHSLRFLLKNKERWWAIQENTEIFDDQLWKKYGNQCSSRYAEEQRQFQREFKLWTKQDIFSLENFIDTLENKLNWEIEELKKKQPRY